MDKEISVLRNFIKAVLSEKAGRVPLQTFDPISLEALKDDEMLDPNNQEEPAGDS